MAIQVSSPMPIVLETQSRIVFRHNQKAALFVGLGMAAAGVAAFVLIPDGIRFVFAGGGRRRAELERARSAEGLENLVLLPFQPVDRLTHSLSLGDVHFVSLRAGFEGLMVPSKAYSVLEAGRGLIYQGTASGEIARLVVEEDIGSVVPLDDPNGLERAICGAMTDPNTVAAWGLRAEALAERLYSRASALQRYAQVFAALNARPSDPKVVPQERAAAVAQR